MQPAGTLWQGSLLESVGSFSRTKSVHKIVNTLEMSLVRWDRYMSEIKGRGPRSHRLCDRPIGRDRGGGGEDG